MYFKIIRKIRGIETIATGHGIGNLNRLNKSYGKANWRKLKVFVKWNWRMALFLRPRYTGTKGTVSGRKK
jgi:hypothetical protein